MADFFMSLLNLYGAFMDTLMILAPFILFGWLVSWIVFR